MLGKHSTQATLTTLQTLSIIILKSHENKKIFRIQDGCHGPPQSGTGIPGTRVLEGLVVKDSAMTNRIKHRGSLNPSVFCSFQTRIFIHSETDTEILKRCV